MKKFLYSTILTVAMLGLLSGCGKKEDDKKTESTTIENTAASEDAAASTEKTGNNSDGDSSSTDAADKNVEDIAKAIFEGGEYKDDIQPILKDKAYRLYNLDETQIEDVAIYMNTGATVEEICVVKTKSQDYVATVKEGFNTRIEEQKIANEDYLPDELPKLADAVIYDNGCYVVLTISADNAKVKELVPALFQ